MRILSLVVCGVGSLECLDQCHGQLCRSCAPRDTTGHGASGSAGRQVQDVLSDDLGCFKGLPHDILMIFFVIKKPLITPEYGYG